MNVLFRKNRTAFRENQFNAKMDLVQFEYLATLRVILKRKKKTKSSIHPLDLEQNSFNFRTFAFQFHFIISPLHVPIGLFHSHVIQCTSLSMNDFSMENIFQFLTVTSIKSTLRITNVFYFPRATRDTGIPRAYQSVFHAHIKTYRIVIRVATYGTRCIENAHAALTFNGETVFTAFRSREGRNLMFCARQSAASRTGSMTFFSREFTPFNEACQSREPFSQMARTTPLKRTPVNTVRTQRAIRRQFSLLRGPRTDTIDLFA